MDEKMPPEQTTTAARQMDPGRVTVQDLEGTSHTAEVTASSLFEAVAQGLAALCNLNFLSVGTLFSESILMPPLQYH
jgi:tRNA A37 threonylcarbamoyladenosine dehydratase